MSPYDVAVVGAGPAGSVAARELARKGLSVLMLEEHQQVGSPVHCSGLVTERTLAVAEAPESLVINRVRGAVIHSPTGKRLVLGGDKVRALVIDRQELDRILACQAQEAGATLVLGSRVVGLERINGHVDVRVRREGTELTVQARLVVGAFGSRWVPAIDSQPAHRRPGVVALGGEARVSGLDSSMVEVYLGDDVSPGWFGWVIPVEGERARVGVGSATLDRSLRQHMERLRARTTFSRFDVQRLTGGVIPIFGRRQIYSSRLLMVGDAAGQVKPTSGGGIYTSIMAAKLCARVASDALEHDDLSALRLSAYQSAWERTLHKDLSFGRHLRQLLTSLTPKEIDALMAVLERPPIRNLVLRRGDIDFVRPLFLELLSLPPLVRSLPALPMSFWLKVTAMLVRWKLDQTFQPRPAPVELLGDSEAALWST